MKRRRGPHHEGGPSWCSFVPGSVIGMRSTGLSHVTFIVSDLDHMEHVLTAVLGAVRVYDSGSDTFSLSEERFFLIGDGDTATWVAIMRVIVSRIWTWSR